MKKKTPRTNCLINISLNLALFFFSFFFCCCIQSIFFVWQFYSHGYDFRIVDAIFGVIVMRKCSCDGKIFRKNFELIVLKALTFLFYFITFLLHFLFVWVLSSGSLDIPKSLRFKAKVQTYAPQNRQCIAYIVLQSSSKCANGFFFSLLFTLNRYLYSFKLNWFLNCFLFLIDREKLNKQSRGIK